MSLVTRMRRMRKKVPDGWELVKPTLEEFETKMREAETDSHEGKRRTEAVWPIFKIHHQRSLDAKLVDSALVAKWKKQGFENLCCLACIQKNNSNFGTIAFVVYPNRRSRLVVLSNAFIVAVEDVLVESNKTNYSRNSNCCLLLPFEEDHPYLSALVTDDNLDDDQNRFAGILSKKWRMI
uniref:Uncharacterized protein n=1 Tax=Ditylenchus dipsaci TaxID=166011 RepID=A0A915DG80_9BILA